MILMGDKMRVAAVRDPRVGASGMGEVLSFFFKAVLIQGIYFLLWI